MDKLVLLIIVFILLLVDNFLDCLILNSPTVSKKSKFVDNSSSLPRSIRNNKVVDVLPIDSNILSNSKNAFSRSNSSNVFISDNQTTPSKTIYKIKPEKVPLFEREKKTIKNYVYPAYSSNLFYLKIPKVEKLNKKELMISKIEDKILLSKSSYDSPPHSFNIDEFDKNEMPINNLECKLIGRENCRNSTRSKLIPEAKNIKRDVDYYDYLDYSTEDYKNYYFDMSEQKIKMEKKKSNLIKRMEFSNTLKEKIQNATLYSVLKEEFEVKRVVAILGTDTYEETSRSFLNVIETVNDDSIKSKLIQIHKENNIKDEKNTYSSNKGKDALWHPTMKWMTTEFFQKEISNILDRVFNSTPLSDNASVNSFGESPEKRPDSEAQSFYSLPVSDDSVNQTPRPKSVGKKTFFLKKTEFPNFKDSSDSVHENNEIREDEYFQELLENLTSTNSNINLTNSPDVKSLLHSLLVDSVHTQERKVDKHPKLTFWEVLVLPSPTMDDLIITSQCYQTVNFDPNFGIILASKAESFASATLAVMLDIPTIHREWTGYRDPTFEKLFHTLASSDPHINHLWSAAMNFAMSLQLYKTVLIHDLSPRALNIVHTATHDIYDPPMLLSNGPKREYSNGYASEREDQQSYLPMQRDRPRDFRRNIRTGLKDGYEDQLYASDGKKITKDIYQSIRKKKSVDFENRADFDCEKLHEVKIAGRKLIFLSGSWTFVLSALKCGKLHSMFDGEYVWVLLEIDVPKWKEFNFSPFKRNSYNSWKRRPRRLNSIHKNVEFETIWIEKGKDELPPGIINIKLKPRQKKLNFDTRTFFVDCLTVFREYTTAEEILEQDLKKLSRNWIRDINQKRREAKEMHDYNNETTKSTTEISNITVYDESNANDTYLPNISTEAHEKPAQETFVNKGDKYSPANVSDWEEVIPVSNNNNYFEYEDYMENYDEDFEESFNNISEVTTVNTNVDFKELDIGREIDVVEVTESYEGSSENSTKKAESFTKVSTQIANVSQPEILTKADSNAEEIEIFLQETKLPHKKIHKHTDKKRHKHMNIMDPAMDIAKSGMDSKSDLNANSGFNTKSGLNTKSGINNKSGLNTNSRINTKSSLNTKSDFNTKSDTNTKSGLNTNSAMNSQFTSHKFPKISKVRQHHLSYLPRRWPREARAFISTMPTLTPPSHKSSCEMSSVGQRGAGGEGAGGGRAGGYKTEKRRLLIRMFRQLVQNRTETSPILKPSFNIENLAPMKTGGYFVWKNVGEINATLKLFLRGVHWPGGDPRGIKSNTYEGEGLKGWRVALAVGEPFVIASNLLADQTCNVGVYCLQMHDSQVAENWSNYHQNRNKRIHSSGSYSSSSGKAKKGGGGGFSGNQLGYSVRCCHGYSIDLMNKMGKDLHINFYPYIVADGRFGQPRPSGWSGVIGDVSEGRAHASFAPLSVTSQREKVVDFSVPYFFSSMSILSVSKQPDIPLLAFLSPFSLELWFTIFISLNITAVAVAFFEWLSPFGLNPWGRQRTKNFSLGSALWVVWGLLFSHLVAFKAPKSWPNKVLINVWGAFSVIFVASYTANIAALFAGLFSSRFRHIQDKSLLSIPVGHVRGSAAEFYISKVNPELMQHMRKHSVNNFTHGAQKLRSGGIDLLLGDTPILDYLRGTDPSCSLRAIAEQDYTSDVYAVALPQGFPFKAMIDELLSNYQSSGYLDTLKSKWYNELPCFSNTATMYKPQALEIDTVAGVFLMLFLGILVGLVILCLEHLLFKYQLPKLREKPKESFFRNRNLMFLSQKLYKFINSVEPVSPHHSAKELATSIKKGQIMGLFQKSVKRKENEQKRRRKSKAQFFEMIQEIRRVQREGKLLMVPTTESSTLSPLPGEHGDLGRDGSIPTSSPLLATLVKTRRRLSSIFRSEKHSYLSKSEDVALKREAPGTMESCVDDQNPTSVVETLVVGSSNVGTTAANIGMKEESEVDASGLTDDKHTVLNQTLSSTISVQSGSNAERRNLYALSHKSCSNHSALGEFGTTIDLEDPPPFTTAASTVEERSYLESQFLQASANIMSTNTTPTTKSSKFIPTEIFMDESTIQIIQSIPDETENSSVDIQQQQQYLEDFSPCAPPESYSNKPTTHNTYSCHPSSIPMHYPLPPFAPPEGFKFDTVSYHVHNNDSHQIFSIQDYSQSISSSNIYSTIEQSCADHKATYKPELFDPVSRYYGSATTGQPQCAHKKSSHMPFNQDSVTTTDPANQLSKQQLWDLLQATDAELRSRLIQTEYQRDHFAQQLHLARHHHPPVNSSQMIDPLFSHRLSNNNSNYSTAPYTKDSNRNVSPMCEYDAGMNIPFGSSSVDGNYYHHDNLLHENSHKNGSTGDKRRQWYSGDHSFDNTYNTRNYSRDESLLYERGRSKSLLSPNDIVTRAKSQCSDYKKTEKKTSLHHSYGDLRSMPKNGKKMQKRRKRSRSRKFYSSTSNSDSSAGASYPISRNNRPFPLIKRSRSAAAEEDTSDSELNRKRKERRLRRRDKQRSTSSQPDATRQRSDPNVEKATSDFKEVTSSSLYGHLFRSLPDVDSIRDDDCTTIATEFVFSQTNLNDPYSKTEDTETGEFDDLSCIDIPAPKFDDTSSTDEFVKSEPFKSRKDSKNCSKVVSHHQHSAYQRYPNYSGVFLPIEKDLPTRGMQPPRQATADRKTFNEADLSPLPILRSLQRQKNKKREEKLTDDKSYSGNRKHYLPEKKSSRNYEGHFVVRDGSSSTSRFADLDRNDRNLLGNRNELSPLRRENRVSKKDANDRYKRDLTNQFRQDKYAKKDSQYWAPSVLISKSVDDTLYSTKNSLSELREKTSFRDELHYLVPSSVHHEKEPTSTREESSSLLKGPQYSSRLNTQSYSFDTRDEYYGNRDTYTPRDPKNEPIYSTSRHPLLYRDDQNVSLSSSKREKSPHQKYHYGGSSFSGYSGRDPLNLRSRMTSRASSADQSNGKNGGSYNERKESSHESSTKV